MTTMLFAFASYIAVALGAPPEPPANAREAKKPVVQQPKSTPPAQPTAEDVLRALQLRRPVNDVIPPGSRAARDAVAANTTSANRLLLPEGLSVVGRTGRLSSQGQWWVFAFDDDASLPAMKLLPNTNLEGMVRTLRGASAPVRFTVTGELTVFDGENFLLPRTALRTMDAADTPAQKSSGAPEPSRVAPDASAKDVLDRLRAQQPNEAILPLGDGAPAAKERARSAGYTGSFLSDGAPLMNRAGRLVRQGSWWTFVSDSDHPERSDLPLRMLPNQGVELMVKESQHGSAVFIVSGEVTLFEGENYLLTRVTTRRADTGNLRK